MEGNLSFDKPTYLGEYKANQPCCFGDPPSPATSGYSELDSEPDTHDSGRVSEMESSPKMAHYARPMSGQRSDARRTSSIASAELNMTRSVRSSKRQSRSSKIPTQDNDSVVIDRRVLRALLLYVRETRMRLLDNEAMMSNMQKSMETFQETHDRRMLTLAKSLTAMKQAGPQYTPSKTLPVEIRINKNDTENNYQIPSAVNAGKTAHEINSSSANSKTFQSGVSINSSVDEQSGQVAIKLESPNTTMSATTLTGAASSQGLSKNGDLSQQCDDCTSKTTQPLYAVVKKKAKQQSTSSSDAYSPGDDDSVQQRIPKPRVLTSQSNMNVQTDSNSLTALEQVKLLASSDHQPSEQSVKPKERSVDPGEKSKDKILPNINLETRASIESRPFPCHQSLDDRASREMAARKSGDGFYITDSFARSDSRSNGNNSSYPENWTQNDSAMPHASNKKVGRKMNVDSKTVALLTKFKRKLKDTKRKVSRTASKDSIVSDSPSVSDPDPRVDVTVTTGDVVVIKGKDDGNNNMFQLPEGLVRHNPKSYLSYSSPVRNQHDYQTRPKLDSTGDNDSRRSTDASDLVVNDRSVDVVRKRPVDNIGYETITFEDDVPLRPAYRIPLKIPIRTSPIGWRARSSPLVKSTRRKQSSGSSLSSIDDAGVELPQTVVNQLYKPSDKPSVTERNGYCVCDITHPGAARITDESTTDDVFINDGYILDEVSHQQDEIRRWEEGGIPRDEPPPKPSRQGYPGSRPGYPPQSSGSIYQPTAAQPGMYPTPRSRVPAVPPKNPLKIMTPEELANYEAQAKLQQRQMEEYNRERLLAQQRNQQREDEKWIEEQMLSPDNPPTNGEEVDDEDPEHLYSSADEVRRARASVRADVPPPPNMPPAKPPRNQPAKDTIAPAPPTASFEEVKPTPTMQLDREGDNIFRDTMSVVKSVLHTNSKTMDAQPDEIVELVKSMGKALKQLCTSLDQEMPSLDEQFHREIDMAQKTTNKDLSQIINQMKLVKKFYVTTQVSNYKKNFMAANQVLAMDAKNLLDVIDKARIHKLEAEHAARPERYEAEEEAESETLPPPPSDLLEQG